MLEQVLLPVIPCNMLVDDFRYQHLAYGKESDEDLSSQFLNLPDAYTISRVNNDTDSLDFGFILTFLTRLAVNHSTEDTIRYTDDNYTCFEHRA